MTIAQNVAQNSVRHELGEMMSSVCFKSAVIGLEEALGAKAAAISLISAGRQRGKRLAESFDLINKGETLSLPEITSKLQHAIGKDGTRLCIVDRIEQVDGVWKVYTRETVCSSEEPEGSQRQCTYTLGAIQGFLESVFSQRLRGKHTESVLRGSQHDLLEYTSLT